MSEQLDTVRIFKFNRGHLFLGGERELVLVTALLCLILVVVLQSLASAVLGVVLWLLLLPVYRLMARADPMMSRVYLKYTRFQGFYPAHGMKHPEKLK